MDHPLERTEFEKQQRSRGGDRRWTHVFPPLRRSVLFAADKAKHISESLQQEHPTVIIRKASMADGGDGGGQTIDVKEKDTAQCPFSIRKLLALVLFFPKLWLRIASLVILTVVHALQPYLPHHVPPVAPKLHEKNEERMTEEEKDILTTPAMDLAKMIRQKKLTSTHVCEVFVKHIKRVNHDINAVVAERFGEALEEAKKVDKRLSEGGQPHAHEVLLGVPCTIKECFRVTGMPNTSGLKSRAKVCVDEDAPVVQRLREAGAIIMGVTNTSELCMWYESSNKMYGKTSNPYNTSRIVGGSSGGEGAIIGSGASVFGLGSDIGGSIRMPAFFNGVFGHKPSGGLVPNTGQHPLAENEAARYCTTGPLCRFASDLWPLLTLMRGPDGECTGCVEYEMKNPNQVSMDSLHVVSVHPDMLGSGLLVEKVEEDLVVAQWKAEKHLLSAGATAKQAEFDSWEHALDIWSSSLFAAGGRTFRQHMGGGEDVPALKELIQWCFGKSPHTLPALTLCLVEKVPGLTPNKTRHFVNRGKELKERLNKILEGNTVLLYPSHSTVAPLHHEPLFKPFNFVHTAVFNILELPVTQVPLGIGRRGVPVGVQVVAANGNDHLTVAVAMELEKGLGGWVPPSQWFGN